MMLVPRRGNFDLFDDFFDDDNEIFTKREKNLMKTDIKEDKNRYLLDIDLPGFEKENINLSLKDGYLNVSAETKKEEKNNDEKMVRRERFYGKCSRSFYVGDNIREEDIKAEFKNGILKIEVPKKEEIKNKDTIKRIEIK